MRIVNNTINYVFNLVFFPFEQLAPAWGLIAISLVTGVLLLMVFRYTSNQSAIKQAKDKIKAHILELSLYRDNLKITLNALANILTYNLVYLKHLVPSLLIIMPIMILILVQLHLRYQYRPLTAGESVLVKCRLTSHIQDRTVQVSLQTPPAIRLDTPVLRIPEQNEFNWRIKIQTPGDHNLAFGIDSRNIIKSVRAIPGVMLLSPVKVQPAWLKMLFNPGENPLPGHSGIEVIEIGYPRRQLALFNCNCHWLILFFIFTVFFTLMLKGVFKVEI